jgi:hypothetical protein
MFLPMMATTVAKGEESCDDGTLFIASITTDATARS